MINKIKANLVFSLDLKSMIKSIWIGPLLITWYWDDFGLQDLEFSWYGWNYWMPQEVSWEENDGR